MIIKVSIAVSFERKRLCLGSDTGVAGKVFLLDLHSDYKKTCLMIIYLFCGFQYVFYFTIKG